MVGTWGAVALMPGQRRDSRAYLDALLGRQVGVIHVWRHFFAYIQSLLLNLQVGAGAVLRCELAEENRAAFEQLIASGNPALYGTFHFGCSDLLGYLLGERGLQVSILRLRVGNSHDTKLLGQRYGERVSFLWVNDPQSLIFDLKAAIEAGSSLALKCDRLEFSAKSEYFSFLDADRLFPFSIYHLAMLFGLPVVFCVAVGGPGDGGVRVMASPVYRADPAAGREANLAAARRHFQAVLSELETLLRVHPYQWFNFLPLNPVA